MKDIKNEEVKREIGRGEERREGDGEGMERSTFLDIEISQSTTFYICKGTNFSRDVFHLHDISKKK